MKKRLRQTEPKIEFTASYVVQRSDLLLEFLYKKVNNSRNNVKMLLKNHQVFVNGIVVTNFDFSLAKDDEVKISKRPMTTQNFDKATNRIRVPKVDIIYEDEDFIAIDKPSGLLAVESDNEHTKTAYNYVLQYLRNKDKDLRPYIIHRIDKDTSGVLIFTKNIKIHSMLRLKWNDYVKTREYHALVEGKVSEEGTIKSRLANNENHMMYASKTKGSLAITHYYPVEYNEFHSLLRVLIDTGKKNQIRVHLKDMGHPIVSDEKYGNNKGVISRLGLHASKLEFIHPITKNLISIKSKVPAAFYSVFK